LELILRKLPVRTGVQGCLINNLPQIRAFGRDRYPRLVLTIHYLRIANARLALW